MQTLTVNGIEIAWRRRGRGTPLVLVHGFPLDGSIWDDVVPLLADEFDLIVPDLRGFGRSTTSDGPCSITDMSGDIAALLDHLDLSETMLAGHSMGGYVALAFAKKHPGRASGLCLVSSQAGADTPEGKAGRYQTIEAVNAAGTASLVDTMAPRLTPEPRLQESLRALMSRQSRAAVTGALGAMAGRKDLTGFLSSFADPLVLVHGDADPLIPLSRAYDVKAAAPSALVVEVPGAGHMPMLENPAATAAGILKLLC